MATPDLTPFGFTATESRVYGALLQLGPATGYAVARASRLARANAYGALDGLVSRGAASRAAGRPVRYRPSDPQALLARLAAQQGEALERLSRALEGASRSGEPDTRAVDGLRALANVLMQVVARAEHKVAGVVASDLLRLTLPAWRRAAGRATLDVRVAGGAEPPPEVAAFSFGTAPGTHPTLLLIDGRQTVAAVGAGVEHTGIWSSHPVVAAIARTALGNMP